MRTLWRWTKALPVLLATPVLLLLAASVVALCDLWWLLLLGRRKIDDAGPNRTRPAASVVIPNWNGRDLAREVPAKRGGRTRRQS